MNIHPTAIVSPDAELGESVTVGPFAIIEEGTKIGNGCRIDAQGQIRKGTTLGDNCEVGSGAIIGANPQFAGFDPSIPSGVKAGANNIFREYVTIHRSFQENVDTLVGDGNYLMTGTHVGHDSVVGDGNTTANNVMFAGHVDIGNYCFFGGGTGIHQFIRIGDYVMAQGLSGLSQDIPPFCMTAAGVNIISGLNIIGMRRAGFDPPTRTRIKQAFAMIYQKKIPANEAFQEIPEEDRSEAIRSFFAFFESPGKKGICLKLKK